MERRVLWSSQSVFDPHPASASASRTYVAYYLAAHDLGHLVDDVQLVVSELATNAAVHAGTPFTVTLLGHADRVLLRVEDESARLLRRSPASPTDTFGRGLTIVDVVSSEWGVTALPDGGKSVWASFPTQVAVEEATHAAGAPPEPVPDGSRSGYGFQPLL